MWHTLREEIGDDAFWAMVRAWPSVHDNANATREQYVDWVEETTGEELSEFFGAWLDGTETPPREVLRAQHHRPRPGSRRWKHRLGARLGVLVGRVVPSATSAPGRLDLGLRRPRPPLSSSASAPSSAASRSAAGSGSANGSEKPAVPESVASICRTLTSCWLMLSRRWVAAVSSRSDSARIRSAVARASSTSASAREVASCTSRAASAWACSSSRRPCARWLSTWARIDSSWAWVAGLLLLELRGRTPPPLGQRGLEVRGGGRRLGALLLVERLGLLPVGRGIALRGLAFLLGGSLRVVEHPLGLGLHLAEVPLGVLLGLGAHVHGAPARPPWRSPRCRRGPGRGSPRPPPRPGRGSCPPAHRGG